MSSDQMASYELGDDSEWNITMETYWPNLIRMWPYAIPCVIVSLLHLNAYLITRLSRPSVFKSHQPENCKKDGLYAYRIVLYIDIPMYFSPRSVKMDNALQIQLLSHSRETMAELHLTEKHLRSSLKLPSLINVALRMLGYLKLFDLFGFCQVSYLRQVHFQLRRDQPMSHLLGVRSRLAHAIPSQKDPYRGIFLHGIATYCLRSGLTYYSSFEQPLSPLEILQIASNKQRGVFKSSLAEWMGNLKHVHYAFGTGATEPAQLDLGSPGGGAGMPSEDDVSGYAAQVQQKQVSKPVSSSHSHSRPKKTKDAVKKTKRGQNGNLEPALGLIYAEEPPFSCLSKFFQLPYDWNAHIHAGIQMNFVYEQLLRYYVRDKDTANAIETVPTAASVPKSNLSITASPSLTAKASVTPGQGPKLGGFSSKDSPAGAPQGNRAKSLFFGESQDALLINPTEFALDYWRMVNTELLQLSNGSPRIGSIKKVDSSAQRIQKLHEYLTRMRRGVLFMPRYTPVESFYFRWILLLLSQLVQAKALFCVAVLNSSKTLSILLAVLFSSLFSVVIIDQLATLYLVTMKTQMDHLDKSCRNLMYEFRSMPACWLATKLNIHDYRLNFFRKLFRLVCCFFCLALHFAIPFAAFTTLLHSLQFQDQEESTLYFNLKHGGRQQFNYFDLGEQESELVLIMALTFANVICTLRLWPFLINLLRAKLRERYCYWQLELRNLASFDIPKESDLDND